MHSSSLLIQLEGEALFPPKNCQLFFFEITWRTHERNCWVWQFCSVMWFHRSSKHRFVLLFVDSLRAVFVSSSILERFGKRSQVTFSCANNIKEHDNNKQTTRLERWKEVVLGGPVFFFSSWQVLGARCFFGFWTSRELFPLQKKSGPRLGYCWWKKSCTSWYGESTIIYRVVSRWCRISSINSTIIEMFLSPSHGGFM